MSKSKLENLGFYATEEITDYEWLTAYGLTSPEVAASHPIPS